MPTRLVLMLALIATSPLRAEPSAAEQKVQDAIKADQVSVVHLWAPWCGNCQAELKSGGWKEIIKESPDTRFLFVSIWNSGGDGRDLLTQYEIANQPNVTVLADPGPRGTGRIKTFLGMPVSWIPTTWIYKGGELRFAMNYGEVRFPILKQLLQDTRSEWSHSSPGAGGH